MISLRTVSKRYGEVAAVQELSLDVGSGELCALVGPSGCGKTTTLKMVNRLIEPSSGEILLDDENVLGLDPVRLRRRIGYVMQSGGLFPHLRVAANVGTVPRLLGWGKEAIRARVHELLELVGLDPDIYGRRYPHELSGGERQRVGVARALGGDPPVLLMDEPFAAVDPVTRKRLQQEFSELQKRLGKTVVLVTHDIDEAVALGTRIAVLSKGARLEQYDTPAAVLGQPATPFVAEFVGADRGLRRLGVTTIGAADVVSVPVIEESAPAADAEAFLASRGSRFAVVLDRDRRPVGWLERDGAGERGAASARFDPTTDPGVPGRDGSRPANGALRRLEGTVDIGTSLKDALSQMLQHDAGFVAVVEHGRYLGVLTPDDVHAAIRRSIRSDPAASPSSPPPSPGSRG